MTSVNNSLSSVASSAVIMLIGSLFGRGLALATEALMARSLTPEIFGRISLAYTIIITIANVLLLGVNQGIPRLLSANESGEKESSLIQSAFFFSLLTGSIGVIVILMIVQNWPGLYGDENKYKYIIIFSPFLILFPLSRISVSVLRSWELTWPAIFSRAIVSRTLGLALWGLLFYFGYSIEAAISYWISIPLIIVIVSSIFIHRKIPIQDFILKYPDKEVAKQLITFSWPLAMSAIMFMFLSRMDVIMIGYYLSSTEVGYYRAIQPLRQSTVIVLASFGFLFLPLATNFYENDAIADLDRLFTSVTKWVVVTTLPVILGLTLFSKDVVTFLLGKSYLPSALPLSLLVGGFFVRAVTGLDGEVTKAINKPKIELYAALVGTLINILLNIVLIPRYGIAGAAVATVFGYAIYNGVELYAIYRFVGITPFSNNIFKSALFTTAVALVYVRLVDIPSSITYVILSTILFMFVSFLSLPLTGSVSEADLLLIKRLEKRTNVDFQFLRQLLDIK
ncbi:flippase [Haladaptatus salinisoli]|uniref:flippase n=1 Tax=Haladaptatus salinisoli TaxID=2884876 RepID=UPI001D0AC5E8|nr:flippase [Haladaptatus salinisoli]